jgi:putative peptide zinc metalloprotease protein
VVRMDDPVLTKQIDAQAARLQQASVRYDAVRMTDPAQGGQLVLARDREAAALADLQARSHRLEVHSNAAGSLWLDAAEDLEGRYLREGRVLGYVVPSAAPTVRVIVDQADQDFIRARTLRIWVKLPFAPGETWPAAVRRAVPAASTELPSAALGHQGGGDVAVDPRDESGRKALVSHFEYELALPSEFPYHAIGSRVSVRFEHPMEPIGFALWRSVRRLFLGHFHA